MSTPIAPDRSQHLPTPLKNPEEPTIPLIYDTPITSATLATVKTQFIALLSISSLMTFFIGYLLSFSSWSTFLSIIVGSFLNVDAPSPTTRPSTQHSPLYIPQIPATLNTGKFSHQIGPEIMLILVLLSIFLTSSLYTNFVHHILSVLYTVQGTYTKEVKHTSALLSSTQAKHDDLIAQYHSLHQEYIHLQSFAQKNSANNEDIDYDQLIITLPTLQSSLPESTTECRADDSQEQITMNDLITNYITLRSNSTLLAKQCDEYRSSLDHDTALRERLLQQNNDFQQQLNDHVDTINTMNADLEQLQEEYGSLNSQLEATQNALFLAESTTKSAQQLHLHLEAAHTLARKMMIKEYTTEVINLFKLLLHSIAQYNSSISGTFLRQAQSALDVFPLSPSPSPSPSLSPSPAQTALGPSLHSQQQQQQQQQQQSPSTTTLSSPSQLNFNTTTSTNSLISQHQPIPRRRSGFMQMQSLLTKHNASQQSVNMNEDDGDNLNSSFLNMSPPNQPHQLPNSLQTPQHRPQKRQSLYQSASLSSLPLTSHNANISPQPLQPHHRPLYASQLSPSLQLVNFSHWQPDSPSSLGYFNTPISTASQLDSILTQLTSYNAQISSEIDTATDDVPIKITGIDEDDNISIVKSGLKALTATMQTLINMYNDQQSKTDSYIYVIMRDINNKMASSKNNMDEMKVKLQSTETALSSSRTAAAQNINEVQMLQQRIGDYDTEIDSLHNQISGFKAQIESMINAEKAKKENELIQQNDPHHNKHDEALSKYTTLEEDNEILVTLLQNKLLHNITENNHLIYEYNTLKHDLLHQINENNIRYEQNITALRNDSDSAHQSYTALSQQFTALKAENNSNKVTINDYTNKLNIKDQHLETLNQQYNELYTKFTSLQLKFDELESDQQSTGENYAKLFLKFKDLSSTYDEVCLDLSVLNTDHNTLLNKYNVLNTAHNDILLKYQQMQLVEQQYQQLQTQFKSYQTETSESLSSLSASINNNTAALTAKTNEYNQLLTTNNDLCQDLEKLNKVNKKLLSENSRLRIIADVLRSEITWAKSAHENDLDQQQIDLLIKDRNEKLAALHKITAPSSASSALSHNSSFNSTALLNMLFNSSILSPHNTTKGYDINIAESDQNVFDQSFLPQNHSPAPRFINTPIKQHSIKRKPRVTFGEDNSQDQTNNKNVNILASPMTNLLDQTFSPFQKRLGPGYTASHNTTTNQDESMIDSNSNFDQTFHHTNNIKVNSKQPRHSMFTSFRSGTSSDDPTQPSVQNINDNNNNYHNNNNQSDPNDTITKTANNPKKRRNTGFPSSFLSNHHNNNNNSDPATTLSLETPKRPQQSSYAQMNLNTLNTTTTVKGPFAPLHQTIVPPQQLHGNIANINNFSNSTTIPLSTASSKFANPFFSPTTARQPLCSTGSTADQKLSTHSTNPHLFSPALSTASTTSSTGSMIHPILNGGFLPVKSVSTGQIFDDAHLYKKSWGVIVNNPKDDLFFSNSPIKAGDVILSINEYATITIDDYNTLVNQHIQLGVPFTVVLRRDTQIMTFLMKFDGFIDGNTPNQSLDSTFGFDLDAISGSANKLQIMKKRCIQMSSRIAAYSAHDLRPYATQTTLDHNQVSKELA